MLLEKAHVNLLHYSALVYYVRVDPIMDIRNTIFHKNGSVRAGTQHLKSHSSIFLLEIFRRFYDYGFNKARVHVW